jgi:hypothetical protein
MPRHDTTEENAMDEDVTGSERWHQNTEVEPQELPLKVVPDWDEQVRHAAAVCRLIDRHLDHEARSRELSDSTRFSPRDLCPDQRVQMITDTYGAAG